MLLLLIPGYVASAWGRPRGPHIEEQTAARAGSQVLIQAHWPMGHFTTLTHSTEREKAKNNGWGGGGGWAGRKKLYKQHRDGLNRWSRTTWGPSRITSTKVDHVPLDVWVIAGAKISCLPKMCVQSPTDWLCSSENMHCITASSDSYVHGREHVIMCTIQPWKSSKRHSAPCSHLCTAHILSSALTDRETALQTTGKSSQLEGSCPKGRNREEKNQGEWRLIKGKPCFGRQSSSVWSSN